MSDIEKSLSKLRALLAENSDKKISTNDNVEFDREAFKKYLLQKLESSKNLTVEDKIDLLKRRFDSFKESCDFKAGMLVSWKPGLRNKGGLGYAEPAIVVEKLEAPIFDEEKTSGSPYFKEPLDLIVGFMDEDNDFLLIYVDSRRFKPFSP